MRTYDNETKILVYKDEEDLKIDIPEDASLLRLINSHIDTIPPNDNINILEIFNCGVIKEIGKMSSLVFLSLQKTQVISPLQMPKLLDLHCDEGYVEFTPVNEFLTTLICKKMIFPELPNLPLLKTLTLSDCQIGKLPDNFPELRELIYLGDLPKYLPKADKLITLNYDGQQIEKIPHYPLLNILTAGESVKILPAKADSLTVLECSGSKIKVVPKYPLLERLICHYCVNLQSLPNISTLREIICNDCPLITSIPVLPNLSSLECSACPIREIPSLPNINTIICNGCVYLEKFGQMYYLEHLECQGCTSLENLPEIQKGAIYCEGSYSITRFPRQNDDVEVVGCGQHHDVDFDEEPTKDTWNYRRNYRNSYRKHVQQNRPMIGLPLEEDEKMTKCRDLLIADDTDINTHLQEEGSLILVRDPLNSLCFNISYILSVIKSEDNWYYECLGTVRENTINDPRGESLNINNFDLRHPYGLVPLGDFSVLVPIQDLISVVFSSSKVFHITPSGSISHSIQAYNIFGPDQNFVSANHCQGGSNFSIYHVVLCNGDKCVISNNHNPQLQEPEEEYEDEYESEEEKEFEDAFIGENEEQNEEENEEEDEQNE